MNIIDVIKTRRSIRKYSTQPIEDEKLNSILEAGRWAPSARNEQLWKFVVVKDKDKIKELYDSYGGPAEFKKAPVTVVACGLGPYGNMKCGQPRYTVDVSIAMSYMILEAYEQGLATCWLGSFEEEKIKGVLKIPEDVRIVAVTPLGYAAESPEARPRKTLEEIVCYNEYCN